MKEALYLGVDGGQSGTRFLVVNGAGEIVGCSESAKVDRFGLRGKKNSKLSWRTVSSKSSLARALGQRFWGFQE